MKQYFDSEFGDNWIWSGGPTARPPRSPDLTSLDFFLWSHVKSEVYSVPIESINHLKSRIRQAIRWIDSSVLAKVWKNTKIILNHMIRRGGGRIKQSVI